MGPHRRKGTPCGTTSARADLQLSPAAMFGGSPEAVDVATNKPFSKLSTQSPGQTPSTGLRHPSFNKVPESGARSVSPG